MSKILKVLLFVLLLTFVSSRFSFASTTVTLTPATATYVNALQHNRPQAGGPGLRVGYHIPAGGQAGDGYESYSLLKFALGGIPGNARVNSARLELWQGQANGQNTVVLLLKRVTSAWNADVTWDTRPTSVGGYAFITSNLVNQVYTWNIDALVEDWIQGDLPNYGLAITSDGVMKDSYRLFASPTFEQSDKRPRLIITYTVPGSVGVAGSNPVLPVVGNIGITPIIPQIPNLPVSNQNLTVSDVQTVTSLTTATVTWKTNKKSSSYVYYGNAQGGVNRFDKQAGQNDSVTEHVVALSNLSPAVKYSFKAASVDSTAATTYSPISYFTTTSNNSEEGADFNISSPSAEKTDVNPISSIQSGVENKVAEFIIEKSTVATPSSEASNSSQVDANAPLNLVSSNPVVMIAGMVGTNRVAGIVMIVLGLVSLIGAFIVFETGRRVHKHIKKRLSKKGRR